MERPVSRISSRPKHLSDRGDVSSLSSHFHDSSAFDGLGTRPATRQQSRRASQNNSVSFARRESENSGDAVGAKAAAAPLSPLSSWPKADCSTPQPVKTHATSPTPIRKRTVLPALGYHQASPSGQANTMNLENMPRVSKAISSPGTSLGFSPLQIPALACPVPPRVCGGPEQSERGILPSMSMPARRSSTGSGLPSKLTSPKAGGPLLPVCHSNMSRWASASSSWAPTTELSTDSGSTLSHQSSVDPSCNDTVGKGFALLSPQVRSGRSACLAETPSGAADPVGLKRAQRAVGDGLRPYDVDTSRSSSAHCVKRKSSGSVFSPPAAGADTIMSTIFG